MLSFLQRNSQYADWIRSLSFCFQRQCGAVDRLRLWYLYAGVIDAVGLASGCSCCCRGPSNEPIAYFTRTSSALSQVNVKVVVILLVKSSSRRRRARPSVISILALGLVIGLISQPHVVHETIKLSEVGVER